jgi:tetratricopeptide (TPR) repeat protein
MVVDMMTRAPLQIVLAVCVGWLLLLPLPARAGESQPAPPTASAAPAEPAVPPAEAPEANELKSEALKDLYKYLAETKDADTAGALSAQIERLWLDSGSATVDLLMQRSFVALSGGDLQLALKLLTAVTELQPDYAEGWNRRAFVYHRLEDTERSLGDLRRALALEPNHYKALEGVAKILGESGSKKASLEALRKLMQIHPFLPGVKESLEELSREVEGQGI